MLDKDKIALLERTLKREKASRNAAERILEEKSSELYTLTEALKISNRRLEELLKRKTSELEGVCVNIIDAYAIMDISGNILKMNNATANLIGYDIEKEPINLINLVRPDYLIYTINAFRDMYLNGSYSNYKTVIVTKTGEEKIVQINASIIYNESGKPIAAQGIARDITEESAIRDIVEKQKRQLNLIMDNSPIGITLYDPKKDGFQLVNKTFCKMLGYRQSEINEFNIYSKIYHEDVSKLKDKRSKLIQKQTKKYHLEHRYVKKDGTLLWVKTSATAVYNTNNEIQYEVATIEDITKEKIGIEKLKESENRLSSLISNLQHGILLEDENSKIALTNKRFCEIFGTSKSPEQLKGADCSNIAKNSKQLFKNPDKFLGKIEELLENQEIAVGEELEMVDGRILERSFIPIFFKGKYQGQMWSYDDITIRKKYKDRLQKQKEKYSNIIDNMKLGLMEIDNEGIIKFVNQNFCDISGYAQSELLGKKPSNLMLDPVEQEKLKKLSEKRLKGISESYEIIVKNKKGEQRVWLISGAPIYGANSNIIGSIGIHLDITKQKQLEVQKEELLNSLAKQNKSLNEYAHIVSHDLKSPLRNFSALLSWTKEDFREKLGEESLVNINLMQEKVEKMDHLIENILYYSSIESDHLVDEKIDLNMVVQEIIELIYVPDYIEVKVLNMLPEIVADRTRIQQLFQNIIGNAVSYNDKEKGLIEIDYVDKEIYYVFSIKDNGIGIAPENKEKIFKMFNSLHSTGRSSGIGLSIAQKIIAKYNGEIWVESEIGKGSTFFFSLAKS